MTSIDANPYEIGIDKNAANYVPLTPIGFLLLSAAVYPDHLAVAYSEQRCTRRQTLKRCHRSASAPRTAGDGR